MLEKTVSMLKGLEYVEGVFLYGSVARKQYDSYSDVDIMVMVNRADFIDSLRDSIDKEFKDSVHMVKDGKTIIFSTGLPKIEFYIFDHKGSGEAKKLFLGSRVPNAEDPILLDRNCKVLKMLQTWQSGWGSEILQVAADQAESFLYYYDIMNSYLLRGDTYRAYFYYNLSFFKLATIVAISEGITDYIYAPQWLTVIAGREMTKSLESASSGMNSVQMVSNKEKMLDLFINVINSSPDLFTYVEDNVLKMRYYFKSRYSTFWRLKVMQIPGFIKGGLLYRSARLDTQPNLDLLNWIKSSRLKTIVDLRIDSEILRHGYSNDILNSIKYLRAPVFQEQEREMHEEVQSIDNSLNRMYVNAINLKSFRNAVEIVFKALSDSNNLPLLIHCNAGVDRTGMFIALIQSALGVNREIIRYNYGVASGLRKTIYIDKFLDSIDSIGGITTFLTEVGIPSSILEKVRYNLLETDIAIRRAS